MIDRNQSRLMNLAVLAVVLLAVLLSLSPAGRARSWEVAYRWDHWLGVLLWGAVFNLLHRQSVRRLPHRDPFLLPISALLSGWGLITIWRLYPDFGVRQAAWLALAGGMLVAGFQQPALVNFLRRYKYVWLTGGLLLTGLTLLLGTNPSGGGYPHLWLGCCGIYLQPSEPLKLLLIVYLSAYLADRAVLIARPQLGERRWSRGAAKASLLPLLAPTLIMTGLALLLLVVQRDLGTASIFLFLYSTIVYVATGRKRIIIIGLLVLGLATVGGGVLFSVVQARIEAWLNPWADPSGGAYQVVQSLLALANGGLLGRGIGMGSPRVVPVAHSDFIFASVSEETGLVGALGLLVSLALLAGRGLGIAIHASDNYRRYLAAGLTAHLVAQSILIIGGNLRLLPLTGVTLPFVSYGGSSLVTSFAYILILLHISNQSVDHPASLPNTRPYLQLGGLLLGGLAAAAVATGWWAYYRGPDLLQRSDNPRRAIDDRYVQRGSIVDRNNRPINLSEGLPGEIERKTNYPDLSNIVGYTNPIYGQSGLEESVDPYLRGLQGNPGMLIWRDHLYYGQPPPGLDVRLSIDLELQNQADDLLGDHKGAIVLLNPVDGKILAMSSHPTFDSNLLEETWQELITDADAPLLNRATLGLYPPGPVLAPFLAARLLEVGDLPPLPPSLGYILEGTQVECALPPISNDWGGTLASGCPSAAARLGLSLGAERLSELFQDIGLATPPNLRLPAVNGFVPTQIDDPAAAALGRQISLSPLQAALAAAVLSGSGEQPAPHLVTAVDTPQSGWVLLAPPGVDQRVFSSEVAAEVAMLLSGPGETTWRILATAPNGPGKMVTWYLTGTIPGWEGSPLAVAILLEEEDPIFAQFAGESLLAAALEP